MVVKGEELVNKLISSVKSETEFDYAICEEIVKRLEVLDIIFISPFILDNLVQLEKLPPKAKQRYLFGTITNNEVQKVEEFFKNEEMRNQSE